MKKQNSSLENTEDDIPVGPYCYTYDGVKTKLCPFWDQLKGLPDQENGFCHYLQMGDKDMGFGLLWDQCKECGINYQHKQEITTED